MDDNDKIPDEIVHLARLALTGRPQDVQTYIRRLARRYQGELPAVAAQLRELLQQGPTRQSPLRREAVAPVPVDLESRLQLLRIESTPTLEVVGARNPARTRSGPLRAAAQPRANQGRLVADAFDHVHRSARRR